MQCVPRTDSEADDPALGRPGCLHPSSGNHAKDSTRLGALPRSPGISLLPPDIAAPLAAEPNPLFGQRRIVLPRRVKVPLFTPPGRLSPVLVGSRLQSSKPCQAPNGLQEPARSPGTSCRRRGETASSSHRRPMKRAGISGSRATSTCSIGPGRNSAPENVFQAADSNQGS